MEYDKKDMKDMYTHKMDYDKMKYKKEYTEEKLTADKVVRSAKDDIAKAVKTKLD